MGRLEDRWKRLRTQVTLQDLMLDVGGKTLAALGLGALLAPCLGRVAWLLIGLGVSLSLIVKAKYWKRFWSGE